MTLKNYNATDGAYENASQSVSVGERNPTNFVVVTPEYLVNDTAVIVDPGASYAPGATGIQMLGYKDITFQIYIIGGIGAAAANRTVTVTIEGYNGLDVAAAQRWVDITTAGYDFSTGATGTVSFTSTGNVVVEEMIAFSDVYGLNIEALRVKYDWDADPSVTDGAIVVTARRKAL